MWRTVTLKRFVWIGIVLMLLQMLAPGVSQALARAQAPLSLLDMADWCGTPHADVASPVSDAELLQALHLSACGYCDQAPAQFAGLPCDRPIQAPLCEADRLAPKAPAPASVEALRHWRRSARAPPALA